MAHGTGDLTPTAPDGAAGLTSGATTDYTGPSRVATGRFAAARAAARGVLRPGSRAAAGEESERERQARIDRALRAAEGGDDADETAVEQADWRTVSVFGAGLAIGALLGAGLALVLAPASGFETRMRLMRSAHRTRDRIRRGARHSSRELQRNVSRKLTRGRWAAEDAIVRRRRRDE